MRGTRAESKRNIIASLRWFCAFLFLLAAYWWVMTNFVVRDFWDPQFALKYGFMRARMKEHPNQPLWLILGSSRVEGGLRLSLVADRMNDTKVPLIFNFSLSGADLFRQSICLRRLIYDGPKPQRVGIEILGAYMNHAESEFVGLPSLIVRGRRDEIDDYCSFSLHPALTRGCWEQSRWNPAYKFGMKFPHQTLSLRLIPIPLLWRLEKHFYDKWGWVKVPPAPIPESEYRRGFKLAKENFEGDIGHFFISRNNDRALRDILELCKKNGVEVFLFQMPEANDFQALYSAQANEVIASYLERIKAEYGVPMIDTRMWYPDSRDFTDGHHLNATGAEKFTRRFFDELLESARTPGAR